MEALFNNQQALIKSLERENINFKKDTSSRKTTEYLIKKLERLDKLWEDFQFNHDQLLTFKDESHEYFVRNLYEQTLKYYEGIRLNVATFKMPKPSEIKESDEDAPESSKLSSLISQQRTNFKALSRQVQFCDVEGIEEKWELEDELRSLQTRWEFIDKLHWKIDNLLEEPDLAYEDEYNEHEMKYREIKRRLNRKLSSTAHLKDSTPKMNIPIFSGNYTDWPTFLDLYKETIHHNHTLTKSQKMQHLKSKLKGEAERLIQHLHISTDNYDTAWDILCQRYNNKQLLFTKQIEVFLNQPTVQKQTAFEIKKLHDVSKECLHAIQNLGVEMTTWGPLLVHLLTKKLDSETYQDYQEQRKNPRELAKIEEFLSFLELKFTALEPIRKREDLVHKYRKHVTPSDKSDKRDQNASHKHNFSRAYYTNYKRDKCPFCNIDHALYQCHKFASMPPETKLNSISQYDICKNCLYRHEKGICNSNKRCKICNKQHNTLLHDAFSETLMPSTSVSSSRPVNKNANHVDNENDEILLTTVKIKVKASDGTYITFRALLDQGSQITLITENAAQRLGLRRQHINASVCGVGVTPKKGKGMLVLECKSIYDEYEFETEALIMTKVINNLPNASFTKKNYPHIQNLQLADPEYYISGPIDILLDVKVYSEIIMSGLLRGSTQEPIAQQTRIGWILSGNTRLTSFNCHVVVNNNEDMSRFWEMEEVMEKNALTDREQWCEDFYTSTTRRLPNGKYEVRYPMIENFEQHLGSSKAKAVAQLNHLDTRLQKNVKLHEDYYKFINEYIALGHMKKCVEKREPHCFLPHHDIHKEDSTTTKLRVVFNASSKTKSGYSLNDLMECGPKLHNDIQGLLINWRTFRYVYVADCEKMYRMIAVHENDQHLQKIVWKSGKCLEEYQLCTLTYGTKAAPFLALRTLKQIAEDEKDKYPLAANIVLKNVYVDDLLAGNNNIDIAKQTQMELIDMLKGAGINLRKWSSNTPELLSHLHSDQLSMTNIDFKCAHSTKTLGLKWDPTSDSFTFDNKINYTTNDKYTKRMMLSDMSKLFDPLGWLAPITIKLKILFQQLWSTGIAWDDEIPANIKQEWSKLRNDLRKIEKFEIPRWIGNTEKSIQLHGFSDASEKAMACAVYTRTMDDKGKIFLRLLAAKTKLAPVKKPLTLPRLELCAAVLLTKLLNKIKVSLPENMTVDVCGWTDSMVVLGWLQGDPSRWKTYVANRVREIINILPASRWRHVKSEENAADCATRGLHPSQVLYNQLWWEGPSWLKNEKEICAEVPPIEPPNIEVKNAKSVCTLQLITPSIIIELLNKCSNLTRGVRIMCWISRFIQHTRRNNNKPCAHLSASEMRSALHSIIKAVQVQHFSEAINSILKGKSISSKSTLLTLNPFLDKFGILRVGGRLQHSKLTYDRKHPILLPNDSHLTQLIIDEAHKATLHGGANLTLAYTRYNYWIISGTRAVKKRIRQCIQCRRHSPQTPHQLMGNLPEPRVTPSRPFTHTGVDFTGFVNIKANKGRGIKTIKGYIAVFVCFATKAIHIELVTDLTTMSFLAAFKRMCARRGVPRHVYSDNGTNFVGAAKILNRQHKEALNVINTDFLEDISGMGVTWHFNAPAWPSAGGLWEAAVKSVKHHLKRVIGEQQLTFDEFYTLLAQIEACVNSRPLYALTENVEEEVLTPGHFLIGGPLLSTPLENPKEPINPHTRWQLMQKMHVSFWDKWSKEYLHRLQTRCKWYQTKPNLQINDIVLINEDNMPPSKWAMGKITEVHEGKDGCVRVVTIKTKNGYLKRPIIKLTPLPVYSDTSKAITNDTEQKNDIKHGGRPKRNTRKPKQLNYLVAILTMFMTLIVPSLQHSFNNTVFNTTNTLYFDKVADMRVVQDQWKMIVYYNMTKYWQNMADIQNYIMHLKSVEKDELMFQPIISQFEHELNEINYYNELLQAKSQTRVKRGLINAIGNVANSLFGVLDDKFAEKYERDIMSIKYNEDHLLKMIRNQTSILETENNILKRNEDIMNSHFQYINEYLNNMTSAINNVRIVTDNQLQIITMALSVNVILSNLRRVQDTLLETVTNIHHGRLDMHLISPDELQNQLNLIAGRLQGELVIPHNNERELYRLMQMRAKVTKAFLIIEIKIPLLSQNLFELNKIIPLPRKVNDSILYNIPITPYIAVNMKKDMVIPMTETDLQTCKRYLNEMLICYESIPILNVHLDRSICAISLYNNNNDSFCRTELRQCSHNWIKLQSPGAWLYSCCRECRIRILCPGGLDTKQLHDNGIITVGQGCLIKGDTFTIQAYHDYHNKIFLQPLIDIPTTQPISALNNILNSSVLQNPIEMRTENHNELYNSIKRQIEELKQQNLQGIDGMTGTSHYTVIYSILVPLVLFVMAYAILRFGRKWWTTRPIRTPQQQHLAAQGAGSSMVTISRSQDSVVSDTVNESGVSARHTAKSISREISGSRLGVHRATSPTMNKTIKFDNLPEP